MANVGLIIILIGSLLQLKTTRKELIITIELRVCALTKLLQKTLYPTVIMIKKGSMERERERERERLRERERERERVLKEEVFILSPGPI